jgi:hypothetical protein
MGGRREEGHASPLASKALIVGVMLGSVARGAQGPDALVILSTTTLQEAKTAAMKIEESGARVYDVFLPRVFFVALPQGKKGSLEGKKNGLGILAIHEGNVGVGAYRTLGEDVVSAVRVWNVLVRSRKEAGRSKPPASTAHMMNDALLAPPCQVPWLTMTRSGGNSPPFGSAPVDLSEYMIGTPQKDPNIQVNVIFPESNGVIDLSSNDWLVADMDKAVAEIVEACNLWKDLEPPGVCLHFSISRAVVPTSYEPITHNSATGGTAACPGDQGLWIGEIMDQLYPLGIGFSCFFDKVIGYADASRTDPGVDADWAVTIFVVQDDSTLLLPWASQGRFPDSYFAYAYLGGPFIVMTKNNEHYTPEWMGAVCAHEMGHSFWALDEYAPGSNWWADKSSGYLDIPNGNHEVNASPGAACIMRGQIGPFITPAACGFTRAMVGWSDQDGDASPDIIDTPTITQLNSAFPNPTTLTMIPYTGVAYVIPLPNRNPLEVLPWEPNPPFFRIRHDITVNQITGVYAIVDGTGWIDASPVLPDTKFDTGWEPFEFTAGPFAPSSIHSIMACATDYAECGPPHTVCSPVDVVRVFPKVPPPATCP